MSLLIVIGILLIWFISWLKDEMTPGYPPECTKEMQEDFKVIRMMDNPKDRQRYINKRCRELNRQRRNH